ncbi:hypothetical protein HY468_03050 [Candidatus Roizmanbacteria bacterium]|nr:hypothetical protein [Candidatus Roizmanbacteria bacterium]
MPETNTAEVTQPQEVNFRWTLNPNVEGITFLTTEARQKFEQIVASTPIQHLLEASSILTAVAQHTPPPEELKAKLAGVADAVREAMLPHLTSSDSNRAENITAISNAFNQAVASGKMTLPADQMETLQQVLAEKMQQHVVRAENPDVDPLHPNQAPSNLGSAFAVALENGGFVRTETTLQAPAENQSE